MTRVKRSATALFTIAALGLSALPSARATDVSPAAPASFFADHRAMNQGDVLTVLITESSSASESARTTTDKNDSASASLTNPARGQRQWQAGLGGSFSGGGELERTGQLVARISVVVERRDQNGNLVVRGDQDIELNGEHQRIHLEGAVRPDDVGPDNTVPSWRIMNARIALVGKGLLSHAQSPGILTRILQWLHLE
jgi:flagellar L-ring protein precursor FlgH